MRTLLAGTNIEAATGDYPNGRVQDETDPGVSFDGTLGNEVLFGDIIQLFQKLLIDSAVTPNGNPDNVSNGYQLLEVLKKFVQTQSFGGTVDATGALTSSTGNLTGWSFSKIATGSYKIQHDLDTTSYSVVALSTNIVSPRVLNTGLDTKDLFQIVTRDLLGNAVDSGFRFILVATRL